MTAIGALGRRVERVLVARSEGDGAVLAEALRRRGFRADLFAAIRSRPPRQRARLDRAAERVEQFTDIVFASRASVDAFARALARTGSAADQIDRVRVVAVGPATAKVARAAGFSNALTPVDASGRGVLAMFAAKGNLRDRHVLLPAAADGRREIADGLRAMGARVTRVEAYRTTSASRMPRNLRSALDRGAIRAAVFASPSGVAAFTACAGVRRIRRLSGILRVVAIGATTGAALEKAGFERVTVSRSTTPSALAAAVARALTHTALRRRQGASRSIDKVSSDS